MMMINIQMIRSIIFLPVILVLTSELKIPVITKAGDNNSIQLPVKQQSLNLIGGRLPGMENKKIVIFYFPAGLPSKRLQDSCITGTDGGFQFVSPCREPVQAIICFETQECLDFIADTGIVVIRPLYKGKEFSITALEATSPLNKEYSQYRYFIKKHLPDADSIYNIYARLLAADKADSINLPGYTFRSTDSMLTKINYGYVTENNCCEFIKGLVLYRWLIYRLPAEKTRHLYESLGSGSQNSVYGKAILEFVKSKKSVITGSPLPLLSNLSSPGGKPVRIEDYRGQYLLIDFWGSWCSPCRAQNPRLLDVYHQFRDQKFEVMSIAIEKKRDEWINAIQKDKLPWVHGSDLRYWESECVNLYGIESLPFNILLDTEGKVIAINLEVRELEEFLAGLFNKKRG